MQGEPVSFGELMTNEELIEAIRSDRYAPNAGKFSTYIESHPFDSGNSNCETVLDLLYQACIESHDTDPPEISNGFKELEEFLRTLPLADKDAVFNLCCRLCIAYEHKAFIDGFRYGMQLSREI